MFREATQIIDIRAKNQWEKTSGNIEMFSIFFFQVKKQSRFFIVKL